MSFRQQQQQPSRPESLAAMVAYPFHLNTGGFLRTGQGPNMSGSMSMPTHAPPTCTLTSAPVSSFSSMADSSVAAAINGAKKEERLIQWSYQETKDFIAIRADLERDFTSAKRNKSLWKAISCKMKERGYHRSGEQCKLKWKNLYNRYKAAAVSQGLETSPFYDTLHAVFSDPSKACKSGPIERSSEELSCEDDDEEDESEEDIKPKRAGKKPRKSDVQERMRPNHAEKCRANSMQEVLEEFFQQQQRVEMEWMAALQRREEDRRRREQEWREAMEKLERERMAREQAWREREEQRRDREEMRAKKRDDLVYALLSRLTKEE